MTEQEAIKVLEEKGQYIEMIKIDGKDTLCYRAILVEAFEVAQKALEEVQAYRDAEEQGLLLRNPKDLENAILNRMQEFMDEWRHYSESSVDHFGGKADSMETAMKIVKGAFEQALAEMQKG